MDTQRETGREKSPEIPTQRPAPAWPGARDDDDVQERAVVCQRFELEERRLERETRRAVVRASRRAWLRHWWGTN